jgi:hypothetical protein
VSTALNLKNTFNPTVTIAGSTPDALLPALSEGIQHAMAEFLQEHGFGPAPAAGELEIPADVRVLVEARFHIEKEFRRLADVHAVFPPFTVLTMSGRAARPRTMREHRDALVQFGVIPEGLADMAYQVFTTASPGIHAEAVTEAQLQFVRDTAPATVAALRVLS